MTEYGPLAIIVSNAGVLVAAGTAVTVAWTKNANWAPPQEDIPKAPARVCGLLASAGIAVIWFQTGKTMFAPELISIIWKSGSICLIGLLLYVFLMATFVYERNVPKSHGANTTRNQRIVAGLWLTPEAKAQKLRRSRDNKPAGIRDMIDGCGGQLDLIWPNVSRATAKLLLLVSFLAVQLGGTITLASSSLLLST